MNLLPFTAIAVGSLLAGLGFARGKRSRKGDDLDDPFERAYGAMGTTTAEILGHVGTTDAFTVRARSCGGSVRRPTRAARARSRAPSAGCSPSIGSIAT